MNAQNFKSAGGIARVVLLFVVFASVVGFAQSTTAPASTQPAVYTSKLNNFTCPIPAMPGQMKTSEAANESGAYVSFLDDMGSLLRIESLKIPADQAARFTGPDANKDYDAAFDQSLLPNEFKATSPDTTVAAREFVKTSAGEALFVAVNIPGGSTVAETTGPNPPHRPDSLRGVLIFRQHDYLYIVSNQELPITQEIVKRTMVERTGMLQRQLVDFVGGMSFR